MTEATTIVPEQDGLYVSDCEIARRLGFSQKFGYRLIRQLEKEQPGRRKYPPKDALFGFRRFWPAVLQWHMDYHHVRAADLAEATAVVPSTWQENFHAPAPRKARKPEHARDRVASA